MEKFSPDVHLAWLRREAAQVCVTATASSKCLISGFSADGLKLWTGFNPIDPTCHSCSQHLARGGNKAGRKARRRRWRR